MRVSIDKNDKKRQKSQPSKTTLLWQSSEVYTSISNHFILYVYVIFSIEAPHGVYIRDATTVKTVISAV